MIIAGWILFLIGVSFVIIGLTGSNTILVLVVLIYFVLPGFILLCIGNGIRNRRERRVNQENMRNLQHNVPADHDYYVCPDCGYQVFEDYKCCPKCGVKLKFEEAKAKFCSSCGKELQDEYEFCPHCGKKR